MTDNPFDDLGSISEDDTSSPDQVPEDDDQPAEDGIGAATEPAEDTSVDAATGESAPDESSPTNGPAFPYDDVTQRPLYAREAAWNAFEDALEIEVEQTLREHGVRDAAGRELHDAALRVAAEHPEAIADRLLELRGVDVNR
ncbi:hypothetical protein SAMN06269185_2801 [Natronoarchaeum philippinense]|uniref:Uncharacterized protein n=1 Tax=Natronoarchaeum philippinense TaxID=558529 RepID=A0A285P599_NATPI|nr:hypothetical protein [Natronoarchaeum philippinense]SNZ16890.1 hypothetical protein SAMN06269185_2801 [Natronoarchaeum philippinense]